jgi:hypothetical protein
MHDRVGMAEAAAMLEQSGKADAKLARQAIVAALMKGKFGACCESYQRRSIPASATPPDDGFVPADFWTWDHARDFETPAGGGIVPSGSLGSWRSSYFTTELGLTGTTAAHRFPEFGELAALGSQPVTLYWTAFDVTLHPLDVQLFADEGHFGGYIRRVKRQTPLRLGNVTKSDMMDVIARTCAIFLTVAEQEELASNPAWLLDQMRRCAITISEQDATSDKAMRDFAKRVQLQASLLASSSSLGPPPG